MAADTYRILYCSRNCVQGTTMQLESEVNSILSASRVNNARAGVTGALIFNSVFFAQVLEGPLAAIEATFERIQLDPRHSDLTVLQTEKVEMRDFPSWSMAFAGTDSEESQPLIAAALQSVETDPTGAGENVLSLLRSLVVQEENWALPSRHPS